MRQLFIAAATVAAALALTSCDPKELIVTDNSALERISIEVNNDNPKWDYGEERIFTIVPTPNTAIVSEYGLSFSDPNLVEMKQGELPNQFRLTAIGEGKLTITARAVGHGEVPGQSGSDWRVEKTEQVGFTLQDNRVKPTRPVLTVNIAPGTDLNAKKVLAEDTAYVTADGLDLVLTVSSDESRAIYSLKSDDVKIINVERTGTESWMLKTVAPGRTWLRMTVTDGLGNPFEYAFLAYVFGHITMETQYCPLDGSAGFSVNEHAYPNLTAQVYMAGELFGWPWNNPDNIESIALPTYSGTLNISETFEYLELLDCHEQQDYLYSLSTGPSYNPAPFTPHKAKLNYIVTLSNPYIIIDTLLDDTNLEEPRWFNFWTEGALQQNGVAKVEQPDELNPITFNPGVEDWQEGSEYTIPL